MRLRLPNVSEDMTTPILMSKFRGKPAKEFYRCCKGMAITGTLYKPIMFALGNVPLELTKGIVYSSIGDVGETFIGYISGVGAVRYVYKIAQPGKLKSVARLCYNCLCLPMTIYSKGVGEALNLVGISKLEECWFGSPVYIFDDNRLWMERNYTMEELVKVIDND